MEIISKFIGPGFVVQYFYPFIRFRLPILTGIRLFISIPALTGSYFMDQFFLVIIIAAFKSPFLFGISHFSSLFIITELPENLIHKNELIVIVIIFNHFN